MTNRLPAIISAYLAAADRRDLDDVVACFASDAVVLDEDQEWNGHAGIRQWRTKVDNAFEYTVEVRRVESPAEADGVERHYVYTRLEGNFPGGIVDLTYRFGLHDGVITRLEIVPTDG